MNCFIEYWCAMNRIFLHTDDGAAVDWDWIVVIFGLYVEGTSFDDIVAALLGVNVAVNVIDVMLVVYCFDVVDDVAVNVVSACDNDNVVVVVVAVVDGVVWVVKGSRSPLQVRLSTILELPTVIMIHFNIISDNSHYLKQDA